MFGFLFGKKTVDQINLQAVVTEMSGLYWNAELHQNKMDTVVVHGKYRNREKDFKRLVICFLGDQKIEFKDERGYAVTHIPKMADQKDIYHHVKNIMNVL
jgi:hypothetical protein